MTTEPADDLSARAEAAALSIIQRIETDSIRIRNGREAAVLLEALHKVMRLERGESTSNTMVVGLSRGEIEARLSELAEAGQARQAALSAVPDVHDARTA